MTNSHTRPALFNFLNGTGMGIVFNKWGEVGMGAIRPEPVPLPFLGKSSCTHGYNVTNNSSWDHESSSFLQVIIAFTKVLVRAGVVEGHLL